MVQEVISMAQKARQASRAIARASSTVKEGVLLEVANLLRSQKEELIEANRRDLEGVRGLSKAFIDRLTLRDDRIEAMAKSLEAVSALSDPVGEVVHMWKRPNGLQIGQMRAPLGVVAIIYESRPNVTSEAASLALKAGNAVILRGGKEAIHSNAFIAELFQKAIAQHGLPAETVQLIQSPERQIMKDLLRQAQYIDLVVPRGGEELIRFVAENSTIPVIMHYKGICHTYVDSDANLKMAEEICFNAKVQRPGVCNAMETMLVHEAIAPEFLRSMIERFQKAQVEIRGCERTRKLIGSGIKAATPEDWDTEYLDLILSVKMVNSIEEAIEHINTHGSGHSDAIVTQDYQRARRFLEEIDAAAVYVNASTRFTDGFEFGLGAEVGISTSKIHCRGPMGLKELTSLKYIIYGQGQIRG